MENRKVKKALVRDLNCCLTCTLCGGYFIDATTLVDCLHTFCRGCILRYFENSKLGCPTCNSVYKKKSYPYFRPDHQTQSLVYKLVPGLYSKEMQRREDFYRSTGVRASSSCSDDSVVGDMLEEHEEWVSAFTEDGNQFYSPEDPISLSLEYYQHHLDTTTPETASGETCLSTNHVKREDFTDNKSSDFSSKSSANDSATVLGQRNNGQNLECGVTVQQKLEGGGETKDDKIDGSEGVKNDELKRDFKVKKEENEPCDRRYLRCPAAVSMSHLQKFIRMKYGLTADHRVDIIYRGEVLPVNFSLMDVAYTFSWNRKKPLRFFYRIFTPLKIRPIKIINATISSGVKQLQIVPVKANESKQESAKHEADMQKERHLAQLELQSKAKAQQNLQKKTEPQPTCIYEYEEPDKEEIKKFAEKRDREWALQKRLDEQEEVVHHVSKKRKKNKHSKNESLHKKRKLHAEITSNEVLIREESLKLKVKLTPHNGHKHKHHRSSQSQSSTESFKPLEMSSKEKLLQMRAVRHKHISNDDKGVQATPPVVEKIKIEEKANVTYDKSTQNDSTKQNQKPKEEPVAIKTESKTNETSTASPKPQLAIKSNCTKDLVKMVNPTVQIERHEQTEKQAQKTFLKTFQSYTEKLGKTQEKPKSEPTKIKTPQNPYVALGTSTNALHKSLEQKIASLQQQCTIESSKSEAPKQDKKVSFSNEKPQIMSSPYPPGFTVSKIEAGTKRKSEGDEAKQDKRPSLEITLINPPSSTATNQTPPTKSTNNTTIPKSFNALVPKTTSTAVVAKPTPIAVKRPPPATIPLDRIKKSINLNKSGISIIPKVSEKCDNIGALDLSKSNRSADLLAKTNEFGKANGLNMTLQKSSDAKSVNMSNLQMLSKVAIEQQSKIQVKPRPQIPALQTLKIPVPQSNQTNAKPNLAKLPKLNEINKMQFRMNAQMRNMRQNQNQSVRDIPNPSWLIRQQNQNRLNSISTQNNPSNADGKEAKPQQNGAGGDAKETDQKEHKTAEAPKEKSEVTASVSKAE